MNGPRINSVGGGVDKCIHNIFNRIISLENLFLSWKEFKKGKSKKYDIQNFEFNLEDNIFTLHQELKEKKYKPGQYHHFYVRDPKLRSIHKAGVKDRLVHQALFRILYPIFDKSFIHDSYSCRLNKGTHKGVLRLRQFIEKINKTHYRPTYALKCDIKKFFHSIDHDILFSLIQRKIIDPNTLWLIRRIIQSFRSEPNKGLPLGNVTSHLFANIYLNELDQFIKHKLKEKYYIRYCDDFVILSENREHLLNILSKIDNFLSGHPKLLLHPDKIIKESFNQSLQSYLGILKHCRGHKLLKRINNLIR